MADVQKISLAHEELNLAKRVTEGDTVRVSVTVDTNIRDVELASVSEDIAVETVELGVEVSERPAIRTVGNVPIIPVVEEEAVVVTRLILAREIHLTKTRTENVRIETVPLRREQAEVERIPPDTQES